MGEQRRRHCLSRLNPVPITGIPPEISELSSVIGELRGFASQQAIINNSMLEELKKISERMSGIGEMSAVFQEYRKTMHERFGKVHEHNSDLDHRVEKLIDQVAVNTTQLATWRSNLKLWMAIGYVAVTVSSSLLATYGEALVRAMAQSH
jgi:hypothetical protein